MIPIEQLDASRKLSVCADELAYIQKELSAEFQTELQVLIHDMNQLAMKLVPIEA